MVNITCDDKFIPSAPSVMCSEKGEWMPRPPACQGRSDKMTEIVDENQSLPF